MAAADAPSARREQILAAALRALSRDGVSGATTRAISAEAGVNIATLHYHFGGKDALLGAVIEDLAHRTEASVRAGMRTDAGLRVAIEDGMLAMWRLVEQDPEVQVLQHELTLYALRRPGSRWLAQRLHGVYRSVAESLLAEACAASGETCAVPPDRLAGLITAGLDGLILQYVAEPDGERVRGDLRLLVDAVLAVALP